MFEETSELLMLLSDATVTFKDCLELGSTGIDEHISQHYK